MAVSINCIPVQNYSVSSKFGMRGSSFHYGLDMPGVKGSNIYAAQGGVVKYFGNDPDGYGNYIILEHQRYKFCTLYAHLSAFSTSVGSFVTAGDVIGKMGSTGRSTGSHLHFEIRKNGIKFAFGEFQVRSLFKNIPDFSIIIFLPNNNKPQT